MTLAMEGRLEVLAGDGTLQHEVIVLEGQVYEESWQEGRERLLRGVYTGFARKVIEGIAERKAKKRYGENAKVVYRAA